MPIVLVLLISSALFVSLKGVRVLATLFAVELGAGPFETGLLFALHGLFPFLLAVSAGRVADRFDNRLLMYWGIGGYGSALALPFLWPSLATLYVAVAIGGFTSMLFVLATQNLVGRLSAPDRRTRNFSYYSLGESAASVIGPVCVGLAIDALRHPATFLLFSLFSLSWIAVLFARRRAIPHAAPEADRGAPRSTRDLLRLPAMRAALLTNALVMTGLDLFSLYLPVYAHGLGYSATAIGVVMGAFGVAAFITRMAIPPVTRRWGERAMLAWALALSALAFVAVPLISAPLPLAAAAFLIGLGLGCGQPLSTVLAYNAAPKGRSAEGIAMRLAVSYGAHVVIPPLFGAIGAGLGLKAIFWLCSALLGGGSWLNRAR
jgi:MFS family permease